MVNASLVLYCCELFTERCLAPLTTDLSVIFYVPSARSVLAGRLVLPYELNGLSPNTVSYDPHSFVLFHVSDGCAC